MQEPLIQTANLLGIYPARIGDTYRIAHEDKALSYGQWMTFNDIKRITWQEYREQLDYYRPRAGRLEQKLREAICTLTC